MAITTASGLSAAREPVTAAREAAELAREGLADGRADLVVIFAAASFASAADEIGSVVRQSLSPRALIGASAEAIIGGARELENAPGISVWAASLPGVTVESFEVDVIDTTEGAVLDGFPEEEGGVLLLADPFTFPADALLRMLNEKRPGVSIIGGMASGGAAPGTHRLWRDAQVRTTGAVGVVLRGDVEIRALVSQGCRPIGHPATVTRSDRNVIHELAGRTPVDVIRDTYVQASPEEQEMMRSGLHLGKVVDEYRSEFVRGDFLIRGVLGADEESGAVAVGDLVEVGETVQFHVRDAGSADEDLRDLLTGVSQPAGALLFTCNGRGSRLFGVPDHDAGMVTGSLGVPLAGMFCAGEIGPVGGKNFLHGFTASLALFYEPKSE